MTSTVLKHVVIVRILKPVTLTMENVIIMGVHFRGLNRLTVEVSKRTKKNSIFFLSVFIVFSFFFINLELSDLEC